MPPRSDSEIPTAITTHGLKPKVSFHFFKTTEREPLKPAPGLLAGKLIGDFRLISLIGQGGMGQVWAAKQLSLGGRTVAVKFVRPDRVSEKELSYFKREARAGGRLSHPGLVAIHGSGVSEGIAWLAMELVEGCWTLRDFLDEFQRLEKLPSNYDFAAATFLCELAEAMHVAHEGGVIHRDLKPQNILITTENRPKVTDFGLARITSEEALSQTGDFAGTYVYMSPEQVTARRMGIDQRSDIFSLGVVMYEMLTLGRPFRGDTPHQVAKQIVMHEPPDMQKVRSKIPLDLKIISGKALEKDPDRRYQSMNELATDLRLHLANKPILARAPNLLDRITKWNRRNPTKMVLGFVALIALVIFSALGLRILDQNSSLRAQQLVISRANDSLLATQSDLTKRQLELIDANQLLGNSINKLEEANENLAAKTLEASRVSEVAQKNAILAERRAYIANIRLAGDKLASGDVGLAQRAMEACPPGFEGTWESGWIGAQLDSSLQVLRGHEGEIRWAGFDPTGKHIVSASDDDTVRLWDARSGLEVGKFSGHFDQVNLARFSPDGKRILSASSDNSMALLDAHSLKRVISMIGHEGSIKNASFSPDGMRIVSAGLEPSARLWDAKSGALLATLKGHKGYINSISFAPLGDLILSAGSDAELRLWDGRTGEAIRRFEGHTGEVNFADFNSDGSQVVSASVDKSVRIWDTRSGSLLRTLEGHRQWVNQARFSPDDARVASASGDGDLRLWDVASGRCVALLEGHSAWVNALHFNPANGQLVSASDDCTLRLWDGASGAGLAVFYGHRSPVLHAEFSADGSQIVSASRDQTLRTWDAKPMHAALELQSLDAALTRARFDSSGTRILTASADRRVCQWDAFSGERLSIQQMPGPASRLTSFSFDGEQLICPSFSNTIQLYDTKSGEPLVRLEGHTKKINSVEISPDGRLVASASNDGSVRIWEAQTGSGRVLLQDNLRRMLRVLFNHDGSQILRLSAGVTPQLWATQSGSLIGDLNLHRGHLTDAVFSPDDRLLATASIDSSVILWNTANILSNRKLSGHGDSVSSVCFSPDGLLLVSTSHDRNARIWDAASGDCLNVLEGHTAPVTTASFSPDSSRLVTASGYANQIAGQQEDHQVILWDVSSGEILVILEGHSAPVTTLAFSPDGTRIISGAADGRTIVWDSLPYSRRFPAQQALRDALAGMRTRVAQKLAAGQNQASIRLGLIKDKSLSIPELHVGMSLLLENK